MPVETMDEKKYGRLLAKHLPSVIETDEEQDRLAGILMRLTIPARKLSAEEERFVALLVKQFAPAEVLQYLMDEGGLRQLDLVDVFGAQSVVSAVLAGKRPINLDHARRLSKRFNISIEAFAG